MRRSRSSRGLTLVELLIAILVLSILAGVEVFLLNTALESWTYSSTRVEMQRAAADLLERLLEGGYEEEGIRDAVEMAEAGLSSIGFVPLWTDRSHSPDAVRNPDQKFVLERQFKLAGPTPIGQVRLPDSEDFVPVSIKLIYGSGRDPKAPDDVVQFLDPIPPRAWIRILYVPDTQNDPEAIKFFRWDPAEKRVYESYAGLTKNTLQRAGKVKVERCAFLYYDNLNRLIPMTEGESLSALSLRRATAVKLYLLLSLGQDRMELTSFTNIRNVATIGATVTEGARLPMPAPKASKAFSIGDFYGFKREGIVELLIHSQDKEWLIRLKFKRSEREEDLILQRFQIESPRNKILTSAILDQPISASEFVNLQTIDRSGLYDYDEDEDVRDLIVMPDAPAVVTVVRLDFEGASLFIRP